MDFTLTPEQQSFRDEVRAWLETQPPAGAGSSGSHGGSDMPRPDAYEFLRQWQAQAVRGGLHRPHLAQGVRAGAASPSWRR